MGFADRSYDDRSGSGWQGGGRSSGRGPFAANLTPWVTRLLVANFAVYLVMALGLVDTGTAQATLGFSAATVLTHPWSPLTYMFVHGGFMHVLFNMIGVFFFGPPLERDMGGTAFIRYYLICGVGAALFSVLLIQLIGTPLVVGASGAVFGVMLAFAWKWPDAPIYVWAILPVKAKYLVGIFGLGALWATMQASRTGGVAHWAHLGGLLTGLIYLKYGHVSASWWRGLRSGKEKSAGGVTSATRDIGVSRAGRRRPQGDDLDEVDRILDKIREEGIDALGDEEKRFLDDVSRKYRTRPDGRV